MTADELARRLPTVSGYFYSTITQRSVWGLENTSEEVPADAIGPDIVSLADLATTVSRPVFLEGGDPAIGSGWVGEVSVFDAGGDTSQLWMDFADRHRVFCLVGPSLEEGFYVSNTVPAKWQVIGDEIVMTGVADPDGDFGAAWFHDGLIWAVSGWSRSSDFAEALISVQAFTGPEPEQTDADALEGALGDVIVDVPGFELVDPGPAEVLSSLQGLGNCVQHLSLHWVHPAGRKGVAIEIYMVGFAAPSPCDRGAWLIDDLVAEGASLHDINGVPAALSADGTTMIVVPDTGVVVQAYVKNAANLGLFTPVLEAFALTAAAIEI